MKLSTLRLLLSAGMTVLSCTTFAQSGQSGDPTPVIQPSASGALAPEKLNSIRMLGRSVLAARGTAKGDSGVGEHIGQFRAAVKTLIDAEMVGSGRVHAVPQDASSSVAPQVASIAQRKAAARENARAVGGQMRKMGEALSARAPAAETKTTNVTAEPLAAQQAELFERLAKRLDEANASEGRDYLARLVELREQLSQTNEEARTRSSSTKKQVTPTLQIMPSTGATPIRDVGASRN